MLVTVIFLEKLRRQNLPRLSFLRVGFIGPICLSQTKKGSKVAVRAKGNSYRARQGDRGNRKDRSAKFLG